MGFPSPVYGYRVYISIFARPYAFIEDVKSPDTVRVDALKTAVERITISIAPNRKHFLYQRQAGDTTTIAKLFYFLDSGPAFHSPLVDSALLTSLPVNWKKITKPEKVVFITLAEDAKYSHSFESKENQNIVEAVFDSRSIAEVDSIIFKEWPYCGKNCKALVEKRLRDNPQSTLSFFHQMFSDRYIDEFSEMPPRNILAYSQILDMICLMPDTSRLTRITHSRIWSYVVEATDEDLINLPWPTQQKLCLWLGERKSKLAPARSALIEKYCPEKRW